MYWAYCGYRHSVLSTNTAPQNPLWHLRPRKKNPNADKRQRPVSIEFEAFKKDTENFRLSANGAGQQTRRAKPDGW